MSTICIGRRAISRTRHFHDMCVCTLIPYTCVVSDETNFRLRLNVAEQITWSISIPKITNLNNVTMTGSKVSQTTITTWSKGYFSDAFPWFCFFVRQLYMLVFHRTITDSTLGPLIYIAVIMNIQKHQIMVSIQCLGIKWNFYLNAFLYDDGF